MTGKHPPGTLLLASSPCPFCGTPAQEWEEESKLALNPWFRCGCRNEDCMVQPKTGRCDTKEDARQSWCERKSS